MVGGSESGAVDDGECAVAQVARGISAMSRRIHGDGLGTAAGGEVKDRRGIAAVEFRHCAVEVRDVNGIGDGIDGDANSAGSVRIVDERGGIAGAVDDQRIAAVGCDEDLVGDGIYGDALQVDRVPIGNRRAGNRLRAAVNLDDGVACRCWRRRSGRWLRLPRWQKDWRRCPCWPSRR